MVVLQKLVGSVSSLHKPVESTTLQKKLKCVAMYPGQSYEEFSRWWLRSGKYQNTPMRIITYSSGSASNMRITAQYSFPMSIITYSSRSSTNMRIAVQFR